MPPKAPNFARTNPLIQFASSLTRRRSNSAPGDNFDVGTSTSPVAVNGITINGIELNDRGGQPVATENCPTQAICRSEMLTVWRRLHIEVDSMGPADGNLILGTTQTFARSITINPGQSGNITVIPSPNVDLEVNRFENGRFVVVGSGSSLFVTSNTTNTVTVTNQGGSPVTIDNGVQFNLYDDDNFNDIGILNGDTGKDIPGPDEVENGMGLLTAGSDNIDTNVFAAAYVRPVYDIDDPRDNCLFQANTQSSDAEDLRLLFRQCWDSGGNDIDPQFWYVVVFGAYQHTLNRDCDPSTNFCTAGIVDEITDVTGDGEGSGALIFMEVHRAHEIPGYDSNPQDVTSLANTVAHEVGHLFSCEHGELGLMGDPDGNVLSSQFTPRSIRRIRGLINP